MYIMNWLGAREGRIPISKMALGSVRRPLASLLLATGLATIAVGCAPVSDDAESSESQLSLADLRQEEAKIRAEATQLAGEPRDIAQRVVFLHEIYVDSKGNHAFPEIALHGALWGHDTLSVARGLENAGELVRGMFGIMDKLLAAADQYALAIETTNRQVFIDTYTNYWFTKKYGRERGASAIIDADVLPALNRVHAAVASGHALSAKEKRDIFLSSLNTEQKESVAQAMNAAANAYDGPAFFKELMNRPVVHFAYFPATKFYAFENFADRADRVRCATFAYDLAAEAGWPKVTDAMSGYSVLPEAYFEDRVGYGAQLRAKLLGQAK